MIEKIVLDYLEEKLSVPVVLENITEDEYVVIEKTGSGIDTYINNATLTIQSYSTSMYKAALLNDKVKEAMQGDGVTTYGIIELNEICDCSLNSDYNFTDTTTKKYRYQAVFDITYQE